MQVPDCHYLRPLFESGLSNLAEILRSKSYTILIYNSRVNSGAPICCLCQCEFVRLSSTQICVCVNVANIIMMQSDSIYSMNTIVS